MASRKFLNVWKLRYPEHRYGAGVPSYAAVYKAELPALRALGAGSVSSGLAVVLCHYFDSALQSTLAEQGIRNPDRICCPWCGHFGTLDDSFRHARFAYPGNPLGLFGCWECAVPPPVDTAQGADADTEDEYRPARVQVHAWRLRIPRRAARDLQALAGSPGRAWRRLIREWKEQTGPVPRWARRVPAADPYAPVTQAIHAVESGERMVNAFGVPFITPPPVLRREPLEPAAPSDPDAIEPPADWLS